MELVSIIVAVYNAEKYLRKCLNSIMNQTYQNLEIICVNDGSKDSSLQILEEYAKKDLRFRILTKENEGLGGASARNYGLENAAGKYVSILDSDDFFDLTMIEKAVIRAESLNTDVVVFGGCEFDDISGKSATVPSILNRQVIPDKDVFSYKDCSKNIFQLTQGMAWNKLYKREFINKYSLRFQKIKYTDDAYFTFMTMVLAERISVINENLCFYRINTGISQTDGMADYPDSAYIPYLELKKTFSKYGVYDRIEQSFINCAISFMRYFYDKLNSFESFEYLHNKYRDFVYKELSIINKDKDFFYDERYYLWIKSVIDNTAGEIAFKSARAYGSGNTTSTLRFMFPYEKVPSGSRVALIGAGIMGRHYYSQVMLNSYCDIVCWVENNNVGRFSYIKDYSILELENYDYAVIAYINEKLINDALEYLNKINFDKNKIIM